MFIVGIGARISLRKSSFGNFQPGEVATCVFNSKIDI